MHEPFTPHTEDTLFNMARFLLIRLAAAGNTPVDGISRALALYTLATKARSLGAYKVARFAFAELQKLRLPDAIREATDLGALTVQARPLFFLLSLFFCFLRA